MSTGDEAPRPRQPYHVRHRRMRKLAECLGVATAWWEPIWLIRKRLETVLLARAQTAGENTNRADGAPRAIDPAPPPGPQSTRSGGLFSADREKEGRS